MGIKQVCVVTKLNLKDLRPQTKHIHHQTLKNVLKFLKGLKIKVRLFDRSLLKNPIESDLIITVGGDGTLLAASHYAKDTPLFGINSAPQTSTGFFCVAGPKNFKRYLKQIVEGKIKPKFIPRLQASLNGRKLKPLGLNELLFTSNLPGETARYLLCVGKKREEQKSSGVWVATGAGSTGAIYSAGGKQVSPFSKRLQYFVREPCRFPQDRHRLSKGFLKEGQKIKIISWMQEGMVFIDGAKWYYPVPKKGVIIVRGGLAPLKIFL